MAPEEWYTPAAESEPAQVVAPVVQAPAFELRPLTLGEILDRTFALYRSRFWLFAGIASLSAAVQLLMNVAQVAAQHRLGPIDPTGPPMVVFQRSAPLYALAMGLGIFTFLAFTLTQAATVHALGEIYLGKLTTIGASVRATVAHWLRYIGIAIWQWWSAAWIFVVLMIPASILLATGSTGLVVLGGLLSAVALLGGFAVGAVMYLRNSLAIAASVIEHLPVRPAMRRSKQLAVGTKGRIFMVLLIAGILYLVVGMLESPLAFVVLSATLQHKEAIGAQAATVIINFLGYTVVGPVAMIGLSLVYFDQRVRMEAFDLMVLLGEEHPSLQGMATETPMAPVYAAMQVPVQEAIAPEAVEAPAAETPTEENAGRPDDANAL